MTDKNKVEIRINIDGAFIGFICDFVLATYMAIVYFASRMVERMTIDECIEFAEDINATVTFPEDCDKDRQFFETIVELLGGLKTLKAINKIENNSKEMTMFFEGYNKAIDDVLVITKEYKNHFIANNLYKEFFDEIEQLKECDDLVAEQLKDGVENEVN